MAAHSDLIGWAASILQTDDFESTAIAETPYSIVLKVTYGQAVYYLKQTPKALFDEAAVMALCRDMCGVTFIPEVIACNEQLACFLMISSGDISLRRLCGGNTERTDVKPDIDLTGRALGLYREIQQATTVYVDAFIAKGVPDWRLDKLPALYRELLSDTDTLQAYGLDMEQIARLEILHIAVAHKCAALAAFGIPASLSHADLHDDNMLLDRATQAIGIIDWGESTVEHPFLSLATSLRWFSRSYDIKPGSADYQRLYDACFSGWPLTGADLATAVSLADDLSPLTWALSRLRLDKITAQQTLTEFEEPDSRFKDGLTLLLERLANSGDSITGSAGGAWLRLAGHRTSGRGHQ